MSYTFLVEQGEESSVDCFSDIPLSALSRSSHIAERFCSSGSATESSPGFQFGMTLQHSTGSLGAASQMSCAVGSHVNRSPAQLTTETWSEKISFTNSYEYAKKYNRHSSSLKMSRNPVYVASTCRLPMWALRILGNDHGPLPTPTKTANQFCKSMQKHPSCRRLVKLFGKLTPEVFEWMMGWPIGWSALQPLAMDKYQQWQQRHGTSCAKEPPPEHCGNGQHSIQQRQYAIPLDIKE